MKARFDGFNTQTLPIVEHFKAKGKCARIETSQDRLVVYDPLRAELATQIDAARLARPLSEDAEMLLGLEPKAEHHWPQQY